MTFHLYWHKLGTIFTISKPSLEGQIFQNGGCISIHSGRGCQETDPILVPPVKGEHHFPSFHCSIIIIVDAFNTQDSAFSNHQQGWIDFNTVNPSLLFRHICFYNCYCSNMITMKYKTKLTEHQSSALSGPFVGWRVYNIYCASVKAGKDNIFPSHHPPICGRFQKRLKFVSLQDLLLLPPKTQLISH